MRRVALLLGCDHNTVSAIAKGSYVAKDGPLGSFSLSGDAVWVQPEAEAHHA